MQIRRDIVLLWDEQPYVIHTTQLFHKHAGHQRGSINSIYELAIHVGFAINSMGFFLQVFEYKKNVVTNSLGYKKGFDFRWRGLENQC